jgi:hypothetical protein
MDHKDFRHVAHPSQKGRDVSKGLLSHDFLSSKAAAAAAAAVHNYQLQPEIGAAGLKTENCDQAPRSRLHLYEDHSHGVQVLAPPANWIISMRMSEPRDQ